MERTSATGVDPLLRVERLGVTIDTDLGPQQVISDVSFEVAPGETLAIIGESGSGKSVAVRAVMGLLPPRRGRITAGRVTFDGVELPARPTRASRRLCGTKMGMVFQDSLSALNPVFTVGYQIAELFRVRHGWNRSRAWAAAVEALEHVGIPDAARRARAYPHEFSGGMRQRAVIAMAIALRPRLLIADEPTTALDVTVQAQIMELLERLRQENGMAMILISHDLGVVARYADRVSIMYAGRVVETGPLREVYDGPKHPYTRALMQSIPSEAVPGAPLRTIPGLPPSPNALPSGCAFHPRCPMARERCTVERPALRVLEGGQSSACHFAEEVPAYAIR
ncbi:ABC transporter ATP-binding protein [Agromyces silvae]|uniref:ABC transporter ATP-binding protein n=1 Tax=Agromyces silvae TaxID=3388266 RepID=UPI00280B7BA9|nr:ABC transporter ATP-binding protein [Agromyces protaetiae]